MVEQRSDCGISSNKIFLVISTLNGPIASSAPAGPIAARRQGAPGHVNHVLSFASTRPTSDAASGCTSSGGTVATSPCRVQPTTIAANS
jgi:hypothetical protein